MTDYFDPTTNRSTRKDLKYYRRNFIISPNQWNTINLEYEDYEWNELKFEEANREVLNQVEGIYLFFASPKKINAPFINYFFYVGETNNLNRRFKDYLAKQHNPKSGQYKVHTIIDDFPGDLYFYYVELPGYTQEQRRVIEDKLLIAFTPPINSKYPQGLQSIISAAYGQ